MPFRRGSLKRLREAEPREVVAGRMAGKAEPYSTERGRAAGIAGVGGA
jgi:hypothetical protein